MSVPASHPQTPRQASFEGGLIRSLTSRRWVEVGAGGQLARVVGGGVLSNIDHGDGKRLVDTGGSQHPHGRVVSIRDTVSRSEESLADPGTTCRLARQPAVWVLHLSVCHCGPTGLWCAGWGTSASRAAGASAVVAVSVDVASGRILRVGGALSWSWGRRARRRLAEDDTPAAAVVPSAVQGLQAQGADRVDERRKCGQHDAGEGPALLGFGERDSAGKRVSQPAGIEGEWRGDVSGLVAAMSATGREDAKSLDRWTP